MALLPLEDPAAEALLAPVTEPERFASWHLAQSDGHVSSRGQAGIELLAALRHERAAALAARAAGPIERLYGFVAAHRDKLGRFVPAGPAPRRFP